MGVKMSKKAGRRFIWVPGDVGLSLNMTKAEAAGEAEEEHSSNEGYIAGTVPRDDAVFHRDMLTVEAGRSVGRDTAKRAVKEGMDPAEAKKLWG